jgi:ABC-type sugar transport system ATPase subunit
VARAADRVITMRDGQVVSDEPTHHEVESVA